ncbi:MAG: Flp pilus assembly protein CpaB [Rhodobacteraceae bacterium]|nr:Flp pilus assembly protein CpaB [Paracoccaceae bacterium]
MRIIFLLVLIVGFGMAGYAAFMVMGQFESYKSQNATLAADLRASQARQVETEPVLVSKNELSFGVALTRDDVTEIQWPKGQTPPNVFTSMDDLFGPENSEPRYIARLMEQGEPILTSKVSDFGVPITISTRLAPGMRAFAISVNVTSGVSGFLQPGSYVDIYWVGISGERTVTKLILEDVEVIAIDQTDDEDFSGTRVARTITVQVSPLVVAKLVQAQATGALTLALRGVEDSAATGAIEIDQRAIIVNETAPVVEERICTVRSRNGSEVVITVVPCVD